MFYEGGIRVPMCARWPGIIAPGTKCDEPVITVDFYPTFLELANGKRPVNQPLDGLSIVSLLHGEKTLNRYALYWHFPAYLQGGYEGSRDTIFRTRPVGTIRKGKWKLLQYFEELEFGETPELPELELYDLEADMVETTNLADTYPAKRDELLADMLAWRAKVNAPVPTKHNPDYVPPA
jgi:arylsulfatase A-like enzyme